MKKQILSAVLTTLISSTALAGSSAFIAFNDLDANKDDGLAFPNSGTHWISMPTAN